jgi:hypothetical protein
MVYDHQEAAKCMVDGRNKSVTGVQEMFRTIYGEVPPFKSILLWAEQLKAPGRIKKGRAPDCHYHHAKWKQ